MPQPFRLLFQGFFAVALASGAVGMGCASLGEGMAASGGCVGLQCPDTDAGSSDGTVVDSATPEADTNSDSGTTTSALCATGCVPDEPTACDNYTGGARSDAAAADAAAMADAAPGTAEAGADSGMGPAGDASAGDASPDGGAGVPAPQYACHLTRQNGKAAAVCQPAGSGTEHDPCVDSSDCAPGYGCSAGECLHFCCGGDSVCQKPDAGLDGTFCAVRPLKDGTSNGSTQPQLAPLCVPADNCNLAEPYPCTATDPADCTCPDPSTACMVVGNGMASCITPPGTGTAGDPCPCAWGHVCSQATGKCLKICSLTASDPGCGSGKCQASKQMPDYFGVCVPSGSMDGGL